MRSHNTSEPKVLFYIQICFRHVFTHFKLNGTYEFNAKTICEIISHLLMIMIMRLLYNEILKDDQV